MRDLYGNRVAAGEVSRRFLRNLRPKNRLRPVVWAESKTDPDHLQVYYGVSLGVGHFVRPLYLHTKLCKLRIVETRPQDASRLEDVRAFAIRENDTVKQPCITCQRFFGFISFPIIGNCAEYDVIGNVDPYLQRRKPWREFESACQQHLNAFNKMMQDITNGMVPAEEIITTYFVNTRHPVRPKVLKYQWHRRVIGGFQLIALDSSIRGRILGCQDICVAS